jgi:hypothetical protein
MTADALQATVLRLANAYPTRWWLHWNYPCRTPWVMAVQVYPTSGRTDVPKMLNVPKSLIGELAGLGFEWDECDRMFYANRTHEDGSPYG